VRGGPGVDHAPPGLVERDYPHLAEQFGALGPLVDTLGATTKGVRFPVGEEVPYLRNRNRVLRTGVATGRPRIDRDDLFCEAILALSGTTNGRLAVAGFEDLEARTGVALADLAHERAGDRITFADTVTQENGAPSERVGLEAFAPPEVVTGGVTRR
jgi:nitrate reductase alpha subunit